MVTLGIGNILGKISNRVEILDWYHLMENLEKVGGSQQRLDRVKELLWKGQVKEALRKFEDWEHERVDRLKGYVEKHQHRIVNYGYYQAEKIPIGSGQVESTVGRGARVKLSGAQWKEENVPQVLRHRCACLNGVFTALTMSNNTYLTTGMHPIVNYDLYQFLGIPIGSGEVESVVKRIGSRLKLSGAQWLRTSVKQMLPLRYAYLNGAFSLSTTT